MLSSYFLILAAILPSLVVGVVLHEAMHAIVGVLVGFKVRRIYFIFPRNVEKRFFGVHLRLMRPPAPLGQVGLDYAVRRNGGCCCCGKQSYSIPFIALFCTYIAGPLTNIFIGLMVFWRYSFALDSPMIFAFMATNLLLGLTSLSPNSSDGAKIKEALKNVYVERTVPPK